MIKKFIYWFIYWAFWFWGIPVVITINNPRPQGQNLIHFMFIVLGTGLVGGIGGLVLESRDKLSVSVLNKSIILSLLWVILFTITTYGSPDYNMPELKIIIGITIMIYSFVGALIATSFIKPSARRN